MRHALVIPLLLLGAVLRGQDAPFDRIGPLLTDTAIAVGRLDLKTLDVEAALTHTRRFLPLEDAESQHIFQVVRGTVASLKAAGVDEVYAVLDAREIATSTGVYLVVPASDRLNRDAVRSLISNLPFEVSEEFDRSIVIGSKAVLERMKLNGAGIERDGLEEAFAAAPGPIQVILVPSADQHRVLRETLPDLPAELGGATGESLAAGLRWAALGVTFDTKLSVSLTVQSESEQAAEVLRAVLAAGLKRLSTDPEMVAQVPVLPMLVQIFMPRRESDRLVVKADESLDALANALTGLTAMARQGAHQQTTANHLKQIGLAMHNFHDSHGSFPPAASYDANGEPLLSWRVFLLPFLEEGALYQQFHLDEPWDSEHNRTLIERMPDVFRSPLADAPAGRTVYLAPVGKGLVFDGNGGTPISQITDGTSNTILVVEATATKAVPWTKPEDLAVDPNDPLAGLKDERDVLPMLFGDGSVHLESTQGDSQTYYQFMTRAGGEVVDLKKLKPQ